MSTHTFVLRLNRVPTDDEVDAIYEAGADDAAVITGSDIGGLVEFDREAQSWAHAIGTAIRDIESVEGLRVVGAGQVDEVTLIDIARRVGRSREAVRLWVTGKRGPGNFPTPGWVSPSGERFWSWPVAARWIADAFRIDVDTAPDEICWADQILTARQAARVAEATLQQAPEPFQAEMRPLLSA